jgi:hypothetical protein
MYVLCSTLCYYYFLLFVFMYSYVAVCMFCAVRCVIIIWCYLLFYLQLCSCMYVLCSTLCYYYFLLFVFMYSYVPVCMFGMCTETG